MLFDDRCDGLQTIFVLEIVRPFSLSVHYFLGHAFLHLPCMRFHPERAVMALLASDLVMLMYFCGEF